MHTVNVELGERSYPIHIGANLLGDRALVDGAVKGRDVLLVSNTTVAPLYAPKLIESLAPRRIVEAILPDGEQHKSLANVTRILDVLVTNRFSRDAYVVALGGGVVGDMAGFAAAVYQRGIDFVQIPTTLLAQVDSSVGGKTGVNHPGGKNLIGAFHQPRTVIADIGTLATLPVREFRAGLAEVIKYGLIADAQFFRWLEEHIDDLLTLDKDALAYAVRRSCEMKAEIVGRDEREQGERAHLNLGHTFGHAIESATNYDTWLHGEAVAAGMRLAVEMSARLGDLHTDEVERVEQLLFKAGLVCHTRDISAKTLLEHMQIDKKVKAGRIRLVLLRSIGAAYVTAQYPDEVLRATLAPHFA